MKIYKTQKEVEANIKNGVLAIEGDVKFECSISIEASIIITAGDITAGDITARDITARDITARDITAWDITAWDITAWDINARDITAGNISFYAVCVAYAKFVCTSVKGRRVNCKHFCLDREIEIKDIPKETITIGGIKYDKNEVEEALQGIKAVN